ncbi:MAG: hypothetical protein DRK00_04255 [Thermoprotei archaeon]|nr:MAG: hypothetical protein DRK00_04255 [Thermoprotei archaeon]
MCFKAEEESVTVSSLEPVARVLRSAGQEVRLRILDLLATGGPATFSAMMSKLNLSSGKLNFHLRKLREAGLIAIDSTGLYYLTELGRWIAARVRELEQLNVSSPPQASLVDYRGVSRRVGIGELVHRLVAGRLISASEAEELIARLYSRLSRGGVPVSEEILMLLAEAELAKSGSGGTLNYVCIPGECRDLLLKSYIDPGYKLVREELCASIANLKALRMLSPPLYEYQLKGLVLVRRPAYSLVGAQAAIVRLSGGTRLARIISKLADSVGELVVVLDEVGEVLEDVSTLDGLLPPGKLTVVVPHEVSCAWEAKGIGLVLHSWDAWGAETAAWIHVINSPVPLLLSRGSKVPSVSLAELPIPEPGEAYILPLRLSVPLTTLHAEVEERGVDALQLLERIAQESARACEGAPTPLLDSSLRSVVNRYEVLKPQLALTGFEAAMRMHHGALAPARLAELARRFWRHVSSSLEEVDVVAALPEEELYSVARAEGFNPLSCLSLSTRRSLEEQAVLEGAVQGALRGGSAWPILARSYLTFERLNRILKIAERHGVKRLTFHLEFTACRACRNVGAGLRGICSFCLSASVSHLIRPLTLYKPLDSIASEALEEYRSRLSLEELEEG